MNAARAFGGSVEAAHGSHLRVSVGAVLEVNVLAVWGDADCLVEQGQRSADAVGVYPADGTPIVGDLPTRCSVRPVGAIRRSVIIVRSCSSVRPRIPVLGASLRREMR